MKRFRLAFFVAVFALLGAAWSRVSAQDGAAKTSPPARGVSSGTQNPTHPVAKGDTLWRITQSAYGDPFLWPSLWEVNKSTVSNPHLIYPGQVLAVPSKEDIKKIKFTGAPPAAPMAVAPSADNISASPSVQEVSAPLASSVETAVSSPEPAPASETPSAVESASPSSNEPSAPMVAAPSAESSLDAPKSASGESPATFRGHRRSAARVVEASFAPDGVVAGVKEDKLLVSQGDIVYLDFPFAKPVVGARMGIYRKMGRVRNPSDGRHMGEEIVRMGTLEIIEVSSEGGAAAARILASRDPIRIKDWVLVEK
ncbi:MAG: LysM peptidoglycan-binding domain-containing protein [Endomicrobiia bacterium]|nr:LysM peptidoglycan-binding domain-containing protein [Endomicrobiia bacterium]